MIESYLSAIQDIEANGASTQLPLDIQDKSIGLSGAKLVTALQRLTGLACAGGGRCYVEVGTYRGLTLLSVAKGNPEVACYGIDNFSQFDVDGVNQRIIAERSAALGTTNANLIKSDFEAAFDDLHAHIGDLKVGSYNVDGPHDYRSQLVCLTQVVKYLAPYAVIFVDDSNYEHVRQANKDFLQAFPQFKLLFEAYGPAHPNNLSPEAHRKVRDEYWNGTNIIVHDPDGMLEPMFPPTSPDRSLYINEHEVHSARTAEAAPLALDLLDAFANPARLPRMLARVAKAYQRYGKDWGSRFAAVNTYSQEGSRIAKARSNG